MLPLKLVRSLVLGETINHHPHMILPQNHHTHNHHETDDEDGDYGDEEEEEEDEETNEHQHQTRRMRRRLRRRRRRRRRSKTAGLLFVPTREIVTDTYRLATIARDLGMDLFPTPSLSHIIFSNPPPPPPSPTPLSSSSPHSTPSSSFPSTTTTTTTTCSFSSSSSSWPLQNDAVPIPFPSLAAAPLTHLRYFVNLAAPFFKLVFFDGGAATGDAANGGGGNWDCCSLSMYSRVTGERVDDMEGFCRVLAGKGWTFYKTQKRPPTAAADRGFSGGGGAVYLFRKVDVNRVRVGRVGGGVEGPDGACRVRELRLPHLDFGNAPFRILQYILLMTDDIFCLA